MLDCFLVVLVCLLSYTIFEYLIKLYKDWLLTNFTYKVCYNHLYKRIPFDKMQEECCVGLVNNHCHVNAFNRAFAMAKLNEEHNVVVCLVIGDDNRAFVHCVNRDSDTNNYYDITLGAYGMRRCVYFYVEDYVVDEYDMPDLVNFLNVCKKKIINDNFNWFERLFVDIDDI